MKAPDKIYTDNRGVYAELPIFSQADANVEYIRKDTLMEWLENKIKVPDVSFINGLTYLAYRDVIDKINSL